MIDSAISAIQEAEQALDSLQLSGAISPDEWLERRCYLRAATCVVVDVDPTIEGQRKVLSQVHEFTKKVVVVN